MKKLKYEIDSLILKTSKDEVETHFLFMDGFAVQIESIENPVPVDNPICLSYPKKIEVTKKAELKEDIENYTGRSWIGDYYCIALLYGKEKHLRPKYR